MGDSFIDAVKAFFDGSGRKQDTISRRFFVVTTYFLFFAVGAYVGGKFVKNESRISRDLLCTPHVSSLSGQIDTTAVPPTLDFQPVAPAMQGAPVQAQVAPAQPQVAPAQAPVAQVQPQVAPVQAQVAPVQMQAAPVQAPAAPVQAQAVPVQNQAVATAPTLVMPVQAPVAQVQPQVAQVQPQAAPVETQVAPVPAPAAPVAVAPAAPAVTSVAQAPAVQAPVAQVPVEAPPAVSPTTSLNSDVVTVELPRLDFQSQLVRKESDEARKVREAFLNGGKKSSSPARAPAAKTQPAKAETPKAPVPQVAAAPVATAPVAVAVAGTSNLIGQYTVQIAVNSSPELAQKTVTDLAKQNIQASFWEFRSSKDKIMYLVGSGVFSSVEDAKKHQDTLKSSYKPQTVIHRFK